MSVPWDVSVSGSWVSFWAWDLWAVEREYACGMHIFVLGPKAKQTASEPVGFGSAVLQGPSLKSTFLHLAKHEFGYVWPSLPQTGL